MSTAKTDWLLIETLGLTRCTTVSTENACTPTVIATGIDPRDFVGMNRRIKTAFTDSAVESVTQTTHAVLDDATSHVEPVAEPGAPRSVHAHPVLGPDGTVFGIEVWVGRGTPPPRLSVGTFDFDCSTDIPRHGNGLDQSVLGADRPNDGVPLTVASVWSRFSVFENEAGYFEYVRDIKDGESSYGRTFHTPIRLVGLDGDDRDVQMSTRGLGTRINGIVQVLHRYEGSAVTDRLITRTVAARFKLATGATLARIDLDTGIVKEWLSEFSSPFAAAQVNPLDLEPASRDLYRRALDRIATGVEQQTDLQLFVRLDPATPYLPVQVTLSGVEAGARDASRNRLKEGLLEVHAQLEVGGAW